MSEFRPISAGKTSDSVAILVDADNVPATLVAQVEAKAATLGSVLVRRSYGDMTRCVDWAGLTHFRATHCTTASGKNRADMQLVVDALDIALRGIARSFLIISDDKDFEPLIMYLKENGFAVERFGKPQPPAPVRARPLTQPILRTPVDERLSSLLGNRAKLKTETTLKDIGNLMKGEAVMVQTGKKTWCSYLQSKPDLYVIEGPSDARRVRLKS